MKYFKFSSYLAAVVVLLQFSLAQAEDIYPYKKETIFPAKKFWNEASIKTYRDSRLAISEKEPVKSNAVLNTVGAVKAAARGDGDVACQKKAEDMAKVFGTSLILKEAKCSISDPVLRAGKKLVGQYESSVQDSPDKNMVFDLRDGKNSAQVVSVDWDHGYFQMKHGDSEYSFRYEDGKIIGIAEVTRFRMLQVTTDKNGKATADARAVKNAKQAIAENVKNGRKRSAVAVEPVNASTLKQIAAALPVECLAEPKPKYNLAENNPDPNSKSFVKDSQDVYYRHKIPTPTYTERSNPTCGYEATPLLKGNKKYASLESAGNRLAKAFQYMRQANFCSDSCTPKIVEYLSTLNPSGTGTPTKVEKLLPTKIEN